MIWRKPVRTDSIINSQESFYFSSCAAIQFSPSAAMKLGFKSGSQHFIPMDINSRP
jgi:hypothetical protein